MADEKRLPPCVLTAPPRIWLQINPEDDTDLTLLFPYGEEVTWCSTEVGGAEVEYTRTDLVPRLDRATLDAMLNDYADAARTFVLGRIDNDAMRRTYNAILDYCCPETKDA